jgi:hypothetical protein
MEKNMDIQMRRIAAAVVATLAVGYATQAGAQDAVTGHSTYVSDSGKVVHCVSTESGRSYCGAAHEHYVIKSSAPTQCVQGTTWGEDDRGVWVTGGCTADFVMATSTAPMRTTHVVHCISTASGRTFCGRPHTHYVMAGTPPATCVEGTTWGLDDEHGVWVTGGCKADFTIEAN